MPNDLPPASPPRRLSLRVQIAILGIGATLAAFALVAGPILLRQPAEAEAVAEPPAPPGTFRATPTQWQSLTLEPAVVTVFRAEQNTDGKIATNDDTTTPAYSPFSGRVSKVYAKAGDYTLEKLNPEERGALQQVGARIEFLPFLPGFSTTALIAKIKAAGEI